MNNCVWVAEAGINHNGSLDTAIKLIDLAKKHRFDYVKFQKRDIDSCYTKEYLDSPRESPWGNTQREQKQGLELSINDYKAIDTYCKQNGIGWFYSPWDVKSAALMSQFDTDYVKIARSCATNKELARYYQNGNNKLILSVGSPNNFGYFFFQNVEYILACVSLYPTPNNYTKLSLIGDLKNIFRKVGYSNHSPHWVHPVIASYMGAEMIEVHITLDKNMYGSDQKSSLDDSDLTNMMLYKNNPPSEEQKILYLKQEEDVLKKLRQTW